MVMSNNPSSSPSFNQFANTLSFYSTPSASPAMGGGAGSCPSPSSLQTPLSVSLENRPLSYLGYGGSAASRPPVSPEEVIEKGKGLSYWQSFFKAPAAQQSAGEVTASSGGGGEGLRNILTDNGGVLNDYVQKTQTEKQGLLANYAEKSIKIAKESVSTLQGGARNLVAGGSASSILGGGGPGGGAYLSTSFNANRFIYFGIAAAAGTLFMTFAFLLFPLIVVAPAKFALMFTLGSLSFIVSFGFLRGFQAFFQHVMSWERLPFTLTYFLSLTLTLYSTLFYQSRILAFIFSLVQLVALISFLISYIPGGRGMLKLVGASIFSMIKSTFQRSSSSSSQSSSVAAGVIV